MRRVVRFSVLIPVLLLVALATASAQEDYVGTCTRVIDGDTIEVSGIGTVRLIGVDTPETVHPNKPVEEFGKEASAFTKSLCEGKTVRLEFDQNKVDRYKRALAYVILPDGRILNEEIISQGYGHAYTEFPFRHLERYRALEVYAREQGRGLWGSVSSDAAVSLPQVSPSAREKVEDPTVYITRTGAKYHRDGCQYLRRSRIPISLSEAIASGYTPCSVCGPPRPKRD